METTEILTKLLIQINDLSILMNNLTGRVTALEKQVDELKNEARTIPKSNTSSAEPMLANYKVNRTRQTKDSQQYLFNGIPYGKGRLVLEVVRKYAADNPSTTADELEIIFDGSIQGSIGVIRKFNELSKFSSDPQNRFFLNKDDIIQTATDECAVCNQWSVYNIDKFIDRARELGFTIEKI